MSEAAYTHLAAACKSMTLTRDICGESLRGDDPIREPVVIENGEALVPKGPGLEVELDEERVASDRVA